MQSKVLKILAIKRNIRMAATAAIFLLAVLAAPLYLSGCSGAGNETQTSGKQEADETQTSKQPAAEETTVPAGDEAVKKLSCFKDGGYLLNLVDAGENRAGILMGNMIDPDAGVSNFKKKFYIVDLLNDEIISETDQLEFDVLLGIGKNGEIVGLLHEGLEIRVYDKDYSLQSSFALPGIRSYVFSREDNCIYCLHEEKLMSLSLEGETKELAELAGARSLVSFDSKNGRVLLDEGNIGATGLNEYVSYDLSEQKALYKAEGTIAYAGMETGDVFEKVPGNIFNIDEDSERSVQIFDNETGELSAAYSLPSDGFFAGTGGSRWAVFDQETCCVANLSNGKTAEVSLGGDEEAIDLVLITGDDMMLVTTILRDTGGYALYSVEPDKLEFTGEWPEAAGQEPEVHTASDDLSELQEYADRLESEYDITISLGDECLNKNKAIPYTIVSTESEQAGLEGGGKEQIRAKLEYLEEVLKTYPEDFFETFKNYRGEGGIRFLLAGDLVNPEGSFTPGGAFDIYGSEYQIVLSVGTYIGKQDIHHELWHAVEERIARHDEKAFAYEEWMMLNPEGFNYHRDFDNYDEMDEVRGYTLPEAGRDAYFISTYSATTEKEDRATIIEEIFSDYYYAEDYGEPDPLSLIKNCPHLNAKLNIMAEEVRKVFGTVYWEQGQF